MSRKILKKGNPNSTFIQVNLDKKKIMGYIDTGATLCFGRQSISKQWVRLTKPKEIIIADKSKHQIHFALKDIFIKIEHKEFYVRSIYMHDSGLDLIIGNNFLRLYEPFIQRKNVVSLNWININNPEEQEIVTTRIITRNEVLKTISENLNTLLSIWEKRKFFLSIEQQLDQVCSDNPLDSEKNTNQELITIKLRDPNKEIKVAYRMPYSPEDRKEFQKEIKELLSKKLIRPSASPHSAPAFYVRNHNEIKRGKARMVINYKKLNEETIGDSYKLPRKDYILEKIKGSNWFSSLDAKSGYWQLRLSEETKPLTAFTCPEGHFEWNVLPFGLKQAPSIYQRFMDQTLQGLDHICFVYIDDILIFTKGSEQQHIKDVETVLNRIKNKGIVISKKKSKLLQKEIEFLGLIIKENGNLSLAPHVQEKIKAFPIQFVDRKQIQNFLGCLNYVANEGFFKNLATERRLLQRKISEKVPWNWTNEDTKAVTAIKEKLKVLPQLYNPTENDFLVVEVDADQFTWAGVMRALPNGKQKLGLTLSGYVANETLQQSNNVVGKTQQQQSDIPKGRLDIKSVSTDSKLDYSSSKIHVVDKELMLCKYISGSFTDTETRYHINEKETLSCLKVLEKWRMELIPSRFLLRTDSTYVSGFWRYNLKVDHKQGRLVRWQMRLQQFYPYISLIKSENNSFADTLTREWSRR